MTLSAASPSDRLDSSQRVKPFAAVCRREQKVLFNLITAGATRSYMCSRLFLLRWGQSCSWPVCVQYTPCDKSDYLKSEGGVPSTTIERGGTWFCLFCEHTLDCGGVRADNVGCGLIIMHVCSNLHSLMCVLHNSPKMCPVRLHERGYTMLSRETELLTNDTRTHMLTRTSKS
jgi:hypothetical protein